MNMELHRQGVSATSTLMNDDDTASDSHPDAGVDIRLIGLFTNVSLREKTIFGIGYRHSDTKISTRGRVKERVSNPTSAATP